jgi:hypothetical protein
LPLYGPLLIPIGQPLAILLIIMIAIRTMLVHWSIDRWYRPPNAPPCEPGRHGLGKPLVLVLQIAVGHHQRPDCRPRIAATRLNRGYQGAAAI